MTYDKTNPAEEAEQLEESATWDEAIFDAATWPTQEEEK